MRRIKRHVKGPAGNGLAAQSRMGVKRYEQRNRIRAALQPVT